MIFNAFCQYTTIMNNQLFLFELCLLNRWYSGVYPEQRQVRKVKSTGKNKKPTSNHFLYHIFLLHFNNIQHIARVYLSRFVLLFFYNVG